MKWLAAWFALSGVFGGIWAAVGARMNRGQNTNPDATETAAFHKAMKDRKNR